MMLYNNHSSLLVGNERRAVLQQAPKQLLTVHPRGRDMMNNNLCGRWIEVYGQMFLLIAYLVCFCGFYGNF